MKLGGINDQAARYTAHRRERDNAPAGVPAESRALVPLAGASDRQRDAGAQPRQAAFLAQLIAAKTQAPQARERRRAEPEDAVNAYNAALTACPYAGGKVFSRQS